MQDTHGLSVPIVLWCIWTGAYFTEPGAAVLKRAIAIGKAWDDRVIAPLRAVRRALKGGVEGNPAEALRDQVKAAELAAEREALNDLDALSRRLAPPSSGADAPARARRTLAAYVRAAGAAETPGFSIGLLEEVIGFTVPALNQDFARDHPDE